MTKKKLAALTLGAVILLGPFEEILAARLLGVDMKTAIIIGLIIFLLVAENGK